MRCRMLDPVPASRRSLVTLIAFTSVGIAVAGCGKRPGVASLAAASASASASAIALGSPPAASALPAREDDLPEPVPPSPLATSCAGMSLVIVSIDTVSAPGALDVNIELRNDGAEHVPLMLTGDGSASDRRNPRLLFELTPDDTTPLYGCGVMNGLSPQDFAFIAPKERRRLEWVTPHWLPSKPGRYTLRATYENDPTSSALGHNPPGPRTDRLVARARQTVPCRLVSNAVSFTWTYRAPEP